MDHTGEPTWRQLAWAAVLACQLTRGPGLMPDAESAALGGESALRCYEGAPSTRPTTPIDVIVEARRRPRAPAEVRVLRSVSGLERVPWHLGPPRSRYEDAVIDVAARRRRVLDVVGELSRAVGSRRTTAQRLRDTVGTRPRLPRRELLIGVIDDLATGACSVLEHGYLRRVERPHGLPTARRQLRGHSRAAVVYRDADYHGVVVELDGRAGHDSTEARDRDADRDLVAAVTGATTVRLTWGQVFDRPCWTASQVARLLRVTPRRCGSDCLALTG